MWFWKLKCIKIKMNQNILLKTYYFSTPLQYFGSSCCCKMYEKSQNHLRGRPTWNICMELANWNVHTALYFFRVLQKNDLNQQILHLEVWNHKKSDVYSHIFMVQPQSWPTIQYWCLIAGLPAYLSLTLPSVAHLADCLFYWGFIN